MRRETKAKGVKQPFRMRIRICSGGRTLGHGKVELLSQIAASGSLTAAAKAMGMSYMRAWKLVQDLNSDPARPMVAMTRGGAAGGTGQLTAFGERIRDLYERMDRESGAVARPYARRLALLMK